MPAPKAGAVVSKIAPVNKAAPNRTLRVPVNLVPMTLMAVSNASCLKLKGCGKGRNAGNPVTVQPFLIQLKRRSTLIRAIRAYFDELDFVND